MIIKELEVRGDRIILQELSMAEVLDEYHKRIEARDALKHAVR